MKQHYGPIGRLGRQFQSSSLCWKLRSIRTNIGTCLAKTHCSLLRVDGAKFRPEKLFDAKTSLLRSRSQENLRQVAQSAAHPDFLKFVQKYSEKFVMALNKQEPEDLSDLHENPNFDLDDIVEKTREEVCEDAPKMRAMKTFMSKQRLERLLGRSLLTVRGRGRAGSGRGSRTAAGGADISHGLGLAFPCPLYPGAVPEGCPCWGWCHPRRMKLTLRRTAQGHTKQLWLENRCRLSFMIDVRNGILGIGRARNKIEKPIAPEATGHEIKFIPGVLRGI